MAMWLTGNAHSLYQEHQESIKFHLILPPTNDHLQTLLVALEIEVHYDDYYPLRSRSKKVFCQKFLTALPN